MFAQGAGGRGSLYHNYCRTVKPSSSSGIQYGTPMLAQAGYLTWRWVSSCTISSVPVSLLLSFLENIPLSSFLFYLLVAYGNRSGFCSTSTAFAQGLRGEPYCLSHLSLVCKAPSSTVELFVAETKVQLWRGYSLYQDAWARTHITVVGFSLQSWRNLSSLHYSDNNKKVAPISLIIFALIAPAPSCYGGP